MQFHKRAYRPMDYKSLANLGTDLGTFQANQLTGLNQMINTGAGSPELNVLQRDVWSTIPKQHFKEMYRLNKLTGVETSVHAPLLDTVGITPQGFYSEEQRKSNEHLFEDVLEKAHIMAPDRNVIVNIHSDVITGKAPTTWRKNLPEHLKTKEAWNDLAYEHFGIDKYAKLSAKQKEELNRELRQESTYAVDQRTGQITGPVKFEIKRQAAITPAEKKLGYKEDVWDISKRIDNMNATSWTDDVAKLHKHKLELAHARELERTGYFDRAKEIKSNIDTHVRAEINELTNDLLRLSPFETGNWNRLSAEDKQKLSPYKTKYFEFKAEQEKKAAEHENRLRNIREKREEAFRKGWEAEAQRTALLETELQEKRVEDWTNFFTKVERLPGAAAPRRIVPIEEFAINKAAKTFAEAAEYSLFNLAKGNMNKAPVISIENPPAQMFGVSRADEMKKLIVDSRNLAIEKFKDRGMSQSQAEQAAKKLIGVTWDTGHINLLKGAGYKDEDILKETKKIAPFVKHMHMVDNFGTDETHLPVGMGNVPYKKMQEEVGKAGFKGKSIFETFNFISQFKTSPWPYILDHMNSPVYEMDAAPAWEPTMYKYETKGYSGFVPGYGNILPSQHFSMYGTGFLLPPTFGAVTPGESKRSEFSGTPMA